MSILELIQMEKENESLREKLAIAVDALDGVESILVCAVISPDKNEIIQTAISRVSEALEKLELK